MCVVKSLVSCNHRQTSALVVTHRMRSVTRLLTFWRQTFPCLTISEDFHVVSLSSSGRCNVFIVKMSFLLGRSRRGRCDWHTLLNPLMRLRNVQHMGESSKLCHKHTPKKGHWQCAWSIYSMIVMSGPTTPCLTSINACSCYAVTKAVVSISTGTSHWSGLLILLLIHQHSAYIS